MAPNYRERVDSPVVISPFGEPREVYKVLNTGELEVFFPRRDGVFIPIGVIELAAGWIVYYKPQ